MDRGSLLEEVILALFTQLFLQAVDLQYTVQFSNAPQGSEILESILSSFCRASSVLPDVARVVGVDMKPSSKSQLHLPSENGTRYLCLIVGYFCC